MSRAGLLARVTPLTVSRLAEIAEACGVPFSQLVEGI